MRLIALLICLLLPVSVQAACEGRDLRPDLTAEERTELQKAVTGIPFPEGNHWIATKGDTVLHLIGTLHTNDPRMDAVVEGLMPTLKQADAFYFEVTQDEMDAFEKDLAEDMSPVMITSGPTLIDLMSEDDWAALSSGLSERGIPGWMAAKMRPWFLSMMLGIPPCMMQDPDANHGMDARLNDLAIELSIPQYSLEQVADLMAMFDSHPIEDQVQSLVRMAGALGGSEDQLATMVNAYLEEKHVEIIQLARLQGLEESGLSPDVFDEEWNSFEQQLLVERNNNWMQHILGIQDQTAVIAVGAGHLGDTHGLLNQLQQAGYSLTRASF
ncbi:TraB/GumN family protein [Ruegeria sp. Ofav3-42]|uniref:TraB/GumN family protein n=1 Tax=Ruegeria sp. Ofav3-42 TaxID=2917759 RepID=UPI001EF6C39C|nr:TraB/GumN family protein [Ruegeria sp. Ofav3-42]MCG7519416.1 TraB/GumN family protein [Ruegeria sp. Ofav3-42]